VTRHRGKREKRPGEGTRVCGGTLMRAYRLAKFVRAGPAPKRGNARGIMVNGSSGR
jgi:hypothetical protein